MIVAVTVTVIVLIIVYVMLKTTSSNSKISNNEFIFSEAGYYEGDFASEISPDGFDVTFAFDFKTTSYAQQDILTFGPTEQLGDNIIVKINNLGNVMVWTGDVMLASNFVGPIDKWYRVVFTKNKTTRILSVNDQETKFEAIKQAQIVGPVTIGGYAQSKESFKGIIKNVTFGTVRKYPSEFTFIKK